MRLKEIREIPRELMVQGHAAPVDRERLAKQDDWFLLSDGDLRSFHIVVKVKELLVRGDSAATILDIIGDLMAAD